jgi:curved DNA-binding protein CbpA
MLKGAGGTGEFLSSRDIDRNYVSENVREIFYRLHFNRENDHYLTLALPRSVTQPQIHKRWKDLILLYHPDRNRDSGAYMGECAKRINEAYSALKDEVRKMNYDTKIARSRSIYSKNLAKKLKTVSSRRHLFVSPHVKRLMPKLITLLYIVVPFLILLIIFFENKPQKIRIFQTTASNETHVSANSGEELKTGKEHSALGDKTSVSLVSQSTTQKPNPRSPEKQGGSRGGEEVQMLMAADNVSQPPDETRSHGIPKNVQEEVRLFIVHYILAYEKGDIEGFIKFYSKSAIENNKMDYEEIRKRYKKNFEKGRYKYGLNNAQLQKSGDNIIVTGEYILKNVNKDKAIPIKGNIRWVLSREDGALKIMKSDYDRR